MNLAGQTGLLAVTADRTDVEFLLIGVCQALKRGARLAHDDVLCGRAVEQEHHREGRIRTIDNLLLVRSRETHYRLQSRSGFVQVDDYLLVRTRGRHVNLHCGWVYIDRDCIAEEQKY